MRSGNYNFFERLVARLSNSCLHSCGGCKNRDKKCVQGRFRAISGFHRISPGKTRRHKGGRFW